MTKTKNENQAELVTVSEGRTYKNKRTGDRVVAFHVEQGRVVFFAPEGRGSEDRMKIDEFLDTFELVKE